MTTPTQRVIVLRAADEPRPGIDDPTTNQRYRDPVVTVEERPLGGLADGEVRVRMQYVGVCGSDLHLARAGDDGYVVSSVPAQIGPAGRILGHEGVGTIDAVGSGVVGLLPGDLVAFASIDVCGACDACTAGAPNQCRAGTLIGAQRDGLFGTVVDVPARLAMRVTAGSDAELRALACVEPAANALVACGLADVTATDSVVIFGAGPLGLYCAMVCRLHLGVRRVTVVEPEPARRRLAAAWSEDQYDVEEFFAVDDGEYDVVIEASGVLVNVDRVLDRVAPRGRVVLLGRGGAPLTITRVDRLVTRAITVRGSRGHLGGALDEIRRLHAADVLPLADVVTGVLGSLDELAALLDSDQSAVAEHGKLLVRIDHQPG